MRSVQGSPEPFAFEEHMSKSHKERFNVEFVVMGKKVRTPVLAMNLQSISSMCDIYISGSYPKVGG